MGDRLTLSKQDEQRALVLGQVGAGILGGPLESGGQWWWESSQLEQCRREGSHPEARLRDLPYIYPRRRPPHAHRPGPHTQTRPIPIHRHLDHRLPRQFPHPSQRPSLFRQQTAPARVALARAMAERDATGTERGARWGDLGRARGHKRISAIHQEFNAPG